MCSSLFWRKMETDEGDLADIVKICGVRTNIGDKSSVLDWQFSSIPTNFPAIKTGKSLDELGDLLPSKNDPLMNELGFSASTAIDKFSGFRKLNMDQQEMKDPYNTFSRILQISSNGKVIPREGKPALSYEFGRNNSTDSIGSPLESFSTQISSRNLSIKRSKNQARKVICVPAPTTTNSRPTGEIVPSDLWAWRKYGQKPIKGSPYPRGYYRCSSSKGCPARKQVERSRSDPNMLVITYTSEHNHPWPMQRNALAGSTRPQATKNNLRNSATSQPPKSTTLKEEDKMKNDDNSSHIVNIESIECSSLKEETRDSEKSLGIDNLSDFSQGFNENHEQFNHEQFLANSNHNDDCFADLGELEKDPVQLVFSEGFTDDENKSMDPFSIFDW